MGYIKRFLSLVAVALLPFEFTACGSDPSVNSLLETSESLPKCTSELKGTSRTVYSEDAYNSYEILYSMLEKSLEQYCLDVDEVDSSCVDMLRENISYATSSGTWNYADFDSMMEEYSKSGGTYKCKKNGDWEGDEVGEYIGAIDLMMMIFTQDGKLIDSVVAKRLIEPAKKKCEEDPDCLEKYEDYLVGSSSSAPSISDGSSSSSIMVIKQSSSSSLVVTKDTVSTITGLGSCAPVADTIDRDGGTVRFKFLGNTQTTDYTAMDFVRASYAWNYDGGVGDGSASNGASDNVSYATSGDKNASVTVTMADGSVELVKCSLLHVNGDPITGCECSSDVSVADVADGGTVTWTVTGCESNSEIEDYVWSGGEKSSNQLAVTFTARNQMYAPTVKVSNNDNTAITVACNTVKSINTGVTEFIVEDDAFPANILDVRNGTCMSISGTWTDSLESPRAYVYCDMTADEGVYSAFTMTYDTTEYTYEWNLGDAGFTRQGGYIGRISEGDIQFENICVEFRGADYISCYMQ